MLKYKMEIFINTVKKEIIGVLQNALLNVLITVGVVKLIPLEYRKRKVARAKINV